MVGEREDLHRQRDQALIALVPYFEQFEWPSPPIGGRLAIRGFGLMVVTGILVGYWILGRRAARRGLLPQDVADFVFYTVLTGFLGSHVLDVVFYRPGEMIRDPLLLLRFWDGISSYGGFISGLFGSWIFFRVRPKLAARVWDFVDCLAFAWPFAWFFGRCGCFLAHDHPGSATSFFLAVNFPPDVIARPHPGGPHHDLGLYEALYTLVLCGIFALLGRRDRVPGFFLGLFLVLYAPVRFALDFLRITDATYLGLTPAQYISAAAVFVGAWILAARPGERARS